MDKAFGNPAKLMQNRSEALLKLGDYKIQAGRQTQIEWYLKLETLLRGIIDLSNTSDEMDRMAFRPTNFGVIKTMCPPSLEDKLMNFDDLYENGSEKMEKYLLKISQFRKKVKCRALKICS